MKSTASVMELIDRGVHPIEALAQCGFGEPTEATMEKLKARARLARSRLIEGLYEAANDKRQSAAARAKAMESWERMMRENESVDQRITIIIEGESDA